MGRRLKLPRETIATVVAILVAATALCAYLEARGANDRLRNANIVFANLALCALAFATLWPHWLPSPKRIGAGRAAQLTRLAHQMLFAGYGCAFAHYACSFASLADPRYLAYARANPLGIIVAIFGSLFVLVLSLQCLGADGKVKSFAIKINGVILAIFMLHQALLCRAAVRTALASHVSVPPDIALALAVFGVCTGCLALYVVAAIRRHHRRTT